MPNTWETDSAIGGMSFASSTTSISGDVYDHVVENGRTYHRFKEGKYMLPNDKSEQERLDFQHRVYRAALDDKLFIAPVDNPANVLDIATGTGIWAIEFAQENPNSQVLGIDLSPIQPDFIPPNVTFEIFDVEDEWSFTQKFDFIHMRAVVTCFKDPRAVIASAVEALEPGGYIELRDPCMPLRFLTPPPEGCALKQWGDLIIEAGGRAGRRWDNAQHYGRWLQELGCVDIHLRDERSPIGPWAKGGRKAKEISLLVQHDLHSGCEGFSMALFTRVLGWEVDKVKDFMEKVKQGLMDTSLHAYSTGVHVYARKPL
ncbi:S-adenosyl-L-methionine-dependent methyltransferase [Xylariales sp. PMI_506]|nr:S-adenosyl-L-methionine-dependent methyltransferase [Xylariales sp. PMI_506]